MKTRIDRSTIAVLAVGAFAAACSDSPSAEPAKTPPAPPTEAIRPERSESDAVVRTGEHYLVVCHGTSAEVADASLESAEAAWRVVADLFPDTPPLARPAPLRIDVYRRFEDFRAACASRGYEPLAAERWNLAFPDTLTAYVHFCPECTDADLDRVGGVSWEYRRRVAHEAAHLAAYERMRFPSSRPDWLHEGIATYVEWTALVSLGCPTAFTAEPTIGGWMEECRRLRRAGRLPGAAAILLDRLDPLQRFERFAVWWAFFRFLRGPGDAPLARKIFDVAARTPGGESELLAAARREAGASRFDALSEEFGRYVDAFDPEWDKWSGDLAASGGRWVQWADRGCGMAWRSGIVGRTDYRIAGAFEILPDKPASMMMVMLGRSSDQRFVVVCFDAALGVGVFDGRMKRSVSDVEWGRLAEDRAHAPRLGEVTRFEVAVAGSTLSVTMGGSKVLAANLGSRDVTGSWGVGVAKDALGIWSDVSVR